MTIGLEERLVDLAPHAGGRCESQIHSSSGSRSSPGRRARPAAARVPWPPLGGSADLHPGGQRGRRRSRGAREHDDRARPAERVVGRDHAVGARGRSRGRARRSSASRGGEEVEGSPSISRSAPKSASTRRRAAAPSASSRGRPASIERTIAWVAPAASRRGSETPRPRRRRGRRTRRHPSTAAAPRGRPPQQGDVGEAVVERRRRHQVTGGQHREQLEAVEETEVRRGEPQRWVGQSSGRWPRRSHRPARGGPGRRARCRRCGRRTSRCPSSP